jgi:deoxycytidylate deaminase
MTTSIPRIKFPELFFGFVAPIGASLRGPIQEFRRFFEAEGYKVVDIKVTDVFQLLEPIVIPDSELNKSTAYLRYKTYIKYGNQLRAHFQDDAFLAVASVATIIRRRIKTQKDGEPFSKTVYFINQLKRKEEIDLLRSVYGRLFYQLSVYSRRGARVDYLSREFAGTENLSNHNRYRSFAEEIIQIDENEIESEHGQRVGKIFHDADFIVSLDSQPKIKIQIERFCELIFGSNCISPTRSEYGMFMAKAAALRTLDLSRQVGAAIFDNTGEIISLGSNEVPKAAGGTYWTESDYDARDYLSEIDSNYKRKREILSEILNIIGNQSEHDDKKNKKLEESQFMDALEYGRMLHAEMSAIVDAARLGHSTKGGTLYCTTFPCHICAKNIIGAGLNKVVFLEPYPKSLAFDLHADSIQIEGGDRGQFQAYPSVAFEHFFGVSPRRYRELFERGKRKTNDGKYEFYIDGNKRPIVDIKIPFYKQLEEYVTSKLIDAVVNVLDIE